MGELYEAVLIERIFVNYGIWDGKYVPRSRESVVERVISLRARGSLLTISVMS